VKVSLKAIAIAAGVLWGCAILFLGLINLVSPSYGLSFLQAISSVYPGFHVSRTIGDVLTGTNVCSYRQSHRRSCLQLALQPLSGVVRAERLAVAHSGF